jgi:hypothetical protein
MEGLEEGDADGGIDEPSGEFLRGCVEALSSANLAASLIESDVCPLCVAFKARGLECRDIGNGELGGYE